MSHSITFDILNYSKKLKQAGCTEAQAEIHAETLAEIIDNNLATKQDLKELELRLDHKFKELELRLKHDLTLRFGAMMAASIVIIAALVKLL